MRVYKYPLAVTDKQTLTVPKGAQIAMFAVQGDTPCVWMLIDPDETEMDEFELTTVGTGHDIDIKLTDGMEGHLGSYQVLLPNGVFVGHVFGKKIIK